MRRWVWVACAASVVLVGAVAWWASGPRRSSDPEVPPAAGGASSDAASTPGSGPTQASAAAPGHEDLATASAQRFLDTYVGSDGRVVRHDQGGDTVSEGQAYALLLAAALDDQATVDRVWTWTAENLRRPDGLLSFRHDGAEVVDTSSAPDAELDAVRALLLASDGPDAEALRADAIALAGALRSVLVTPPEGVGPVLAAGEWATEPLVVNPSYFAPRSLSALALVEPAGPWPGLAGASRADLDALTEGGRLPPDWAVRDGAVPRPVDGPDASGRDGRWSYDAARVPIRLAESCDSADRARAAAMWSSLADEPARVQRDLDGRPSGDEVHPVALVAAAAAADAAGHVGVRDALLDEAEELDRLQPTYYGSAWVALGRVMLQTDLLGSC